MYRILRKRGFTLVEMMVVIAIIGLLSAVIFAAVGSAREDARDGKRLADIKQLQLAFKLYAETNDGYPTGYGSGTEIGVGNAIDAVIEPFAGSVSSDPDSGDGTYRYWYDSAFVCNGETTPVLAVRTMENDSNANIADVCNGSYGGDGDFGNNTYIIQLR